MNDAFNWKEKRIHVLRIRIVRNSRPCTVAAASVFEIAVSAASCLMSVDRRASDGGGDGARGGDEEMRTGARTGGAGSATAHPDV